MDFNGVTNGRLTDMGEPETFRKSLAQQQRAKLCSKIQLAFMKLRVNQFETLFPRRLSAPLHGIAQRLGR